MRVTDTSDLWWKTAVVYCLDVETFFDSDGDGVGDLQGLAQRLDHLADLGVTCLWLMPFYPTPDRDDGYDITDLYGVDGRLGSHGDLVEVLRTAHDRGIRVIADLVVNHTSDQHPWFQESRSSKDSRYRDWYVWRDEPPDEQVDVVFPDQEDSVWERDEQSGQYYLHRFYKHQPDLNAANPEVRAELARVVGFWLQVGLAGFRVDAVPFFLERLGVDPSPADETSDPHDVLRDLRAFLSRRRGDAVLLGEVNLPYAEQLDFFGGAGGEGVAHSQWANFVRNHDELTLDKLSDEERQEVFDAFGPEPRMQVYGRGLTRRLPPMLDGDPRRVRMVYSLLFALPGTPVLFYGEEIGMGENLAADGRSAVRTPMQWSSGPNGGFSTAPASALPGPVVEGGFGPEHVNVAAQRNDPDSLLAFFRLLVRRYRECPELGWGGYALLDQPHDAVLAHSATWDDACLVALHNLSPEPVTVPLVLDAHGGTELVDLLVEGRTPVADDGTVELPLDGYGYRWLRVVAQDSRRLV